MELDNYIRRHSFLAQLLFLLSPSIICLDLRFRQNHVLLQKKSCFACVCVQSLQSCMFFATLWTVARQAPLSRQERKLECVAMLFSRGSSQPRD